MVQENEKIIAHFGEFVFDISENNVNLAKRLKNLVIIPKNEASYESPVKAKQTPEINATFDLF